MSDTLGAARRKNLRELIIRWGGPSNFAKKMGYSGPSYLSQMLNEGRNGRPITEKTARQIERTLGLAMGTLDRDNDEQALALDPGAAPSPVLLSAAFNAVMTAQEEGNFTIARAKVGDVVALIYMDALEKSGNIDPEYVRRIVNLLRRD